MTLRTTLDYRGPQPATPRERVRGTFPLRASIWRGMGAVWLVLGSAIGIGAWTGHTDAGGFALVAGALLCVVALVNDWIQKRHAGFLVGLILGALTAIGIAGLIWCFVIVHYVLRSGRGIF